jgi:hypothetical protein
VASSLALLVYRQIVGRRKLVRRMREQLALATARRCYRVASPEDARPMSRYLAVQGELERSGLVMLADFAVGPDGEPPLWITRVLVGERGTMCACLVARVRAKRAELLIESYAQASSFVTCGWSQGGWAHSPSIYVQRVDAGPASLVAYHRRFVRGVDRVAIASPDDWIEQMERAQERERAWRASQDPQALLELDLVAMFGQHRAHEAARWARRIHAEAVPQARARRGND